MKAAIIYYSRSGKTWMIANRIQRKTDAELFKVEPDKKYGNYLSSVVSVGGEKIKKEPAKPKTKPADFSEYDVVFIGFPVWYSTMPQFLQDYVKGCNLDGKHIIPFVTAGANGKESSYETLKQLLPNSEITDYFYTSNFNKGNVDEWLDSLSLSTD